MLRPTLYLLFFFFNDTATTEIYTLSLHDALPISSVGRNGPRFARIDPRNGEIERAAPRRAALLPAGDRGPGGRGSGAAGDPLGPARHAGEQERGGAAAPGGLQDSAREDQAVRHFRRTVPAVLTVASGP